MPQEENEESTEQKPEINISSLPSLVTSHGIQDSFCPCKVNSITYQTFIQVLILSLG